MAPTSFSPDACQQQKLPVDLLCADALGAPDGKGNPFSFSPTSPSPRKEGNSASLRFQAPTPYVEWTSELAQEAVYYAHGDHDWPDGKTGALIDAKADTSTGAADLGQARSNDYCQEFVNSRARPQNHIRLSTIEEGLREYPRMARLLAAKQALLRQRSLPPFYLHADLRHHDLARLECKFDVILIDPPWEEYARRAAGSGQQGQGAVGQQAVWSAADLARLNIDAVADTHCVLFLWCGSGGRFASERPSHLEEGLRLLHAWGFKRVEDLCWLKTNKGRQDQGCTTPAISAILTRTKEHCLVGMKGHFLRSRDGHLVHANIHTDLVIAQEPLDPSCTHKPAEVYRVIEDFCLGRRRLELFGDIANVTVGNALGGSNYDPVAYKAALAEPGRDANDKPCPGHLLGSTKEIESLRPKSPPPAPSEQGGKKRPTPAGEERGKERRDRGGGGGGRRRENTKGARPRAYSTPQGDMDRDGERRGQGGYGKRGGGAGRGRDSGKRGGEAGRSEYRTPREPLPLLSAPASAANGRGASPRSLTMPTNADSGRGFRRGAEDRRYTYPTRDAFPNFSPDK